VDFFLELLDFIFIKRFVMEINSNKTLAFSAPFIKVELISNAVDFVIDRRAILINVSRQDIAENGILLKRWGSAILSGVTIARADALVRINIKNTAEVGQSYPFAKEIESKWPHVYEIFKLPHLKDTCLWRSEKECIGNVEYNLWFARAGTDCGIHNEHNFREMHTQVFGYGRMQKFHQASASSLYQDIYMCPGYTHEPFCDENNVYPWHRYYADTDCIWLAIEIYR